MASPSGFTIVILMLLVATVSGDDCANITGVWYNQLGSEMILELDASDPLKLVGEYRTAAERETGSAGDSYASITGLAPEPHIHGEQSSSVFGFTVLWRGGNSTTAWLAQCLVCGGEERIITSWILRSQVNSCTDKWKAVMTGRNYFARREQRTGPRRHTGTHTPRDHGRRHRRDLQYLTGSEDVIAPEIEETSVNVVQGIPIDVDVNVVVDAPRKAAFFQADPEISSRGRLHGLWFNELGSEMSLHHLDSTTITGSYRTVSERLEKTRVNSSHSEMVGFGNPRHRDTTLSLLMSWNNGHSITAWVGQVHLCTETNRPVQTLEASFLHRTRITQCQAEWKATIHGHTTFTRVDPLKNEGDLVEVREFGEEETMC